MRSGSAMGRRDSSCSVGIGRSSGAMLQKKIGRDSAELIRGLRVAQYLAPKGDVKGFGMAVHDEMVVATETRTPCS